MIDLGLICKFLGIEFNIIAKGIFLHQSTYAQSIIDEIGLIDCNPCKTPILEGIKLKNETRTIPADLHLYCRMVGRLLFLSNT